MDENRKTNVVRILTASLTMLLLLVGLYFALAMPEDNNPYWFESFFLSKAIAGVCLWVVSLIAKSDIMAPIMNSKYLKCNG